MKNDWGLVEKIFSVCVDVHPDKHQRLIGQLANGDEFVEREVEKLLNCDSATSAAWPTDHESRQRWSNNSIDTNVEQLVDGYQIEDKIGQGAFGTVYRANSLDGEPVAIKLLKNWELNPRGIKRFRFEALVLSRISHPNVARLIAHGTTAGEIPYLVTEFIEGRTLDEVVRGPRFGSSKEPPTRINADEIRKRMIWFRDIAQGVASVHEKMILHRDIKPSNIMIRDDSTAVVMDFGLAKCIDPQTTVQSLTATGQIIGTPQFMAPEQLLGQRDLGATADIYSLGAVLYYLLTGRPPFSEDSIALLSEKVRFRPPASPRSHNPNIGRGLAAICLNCLKKRPADRYHSVVEVVEDVERWLDGRPVQARSVSTREHVWLWAKRNRLSAVLSVILFVLTVGGLITTTLLWQTSEANFQQAEYQKQDLLRTIQKLLEVERNAAEQHRDRQLRREMLTAITDAFDRLSLAEELESDLLKTSAVAFLKSGRLESAAGDRDKSIATIEEAKRRFKLLMERHPDNLEYEFDYFHCLLSQRKHEEALNCILSILAKDDSNIDYRATVGTVYFQLASDAHGQSEYETAIEYYDLGEEWTLQILRECSPDRTDFHIKNLAEQWWGRSRVKAMLGQFEAAELDLERATEVFLRLRNQSPEVSLFSYYAIDCLLRQAALKMVSREWSQASQLLNTSEGISRIYLKVHNSHPASYHLHFQVLFHQAMYAFKTGDFDFLASKQQAIEEHLAQWELQEFKNTSYRTCFGWYWIDPNICSKPDLNKAAQTLEEIPQRAKLQRLRIAFNRGELDKLIDNQAFRNGFNGRFMSYYSAAAQRLAGTTEFNGKLEDLAMPDHKERLRSVYFGNNFYSFVFLADNFSNELERYKAVAQDKIRAVNQPPE